MPKYIIIAPALSPYCHELNWEGTGCAVDCAACAWAYLYKPLVEDEDKEVTKDSLIC